MHELRRKLLRLRAECWKEPRPGMLSSCSLDHFKEANRCDLEAWECVRTLADWEALRDERILALAESLGSLPESPRCAQILKTGEVRGDGYRIDKLVFEGAMPGLAVTALLYVPEQRPRQMPGIIIAHSHHHSKEETELQDMGVSWARSGAAVLIPDMIGHGERRDNPFGGRQDYYGRYFANMQLDLVGRSLMGLMFGDLRRCVDLLSATEGVDPAQLMLLGSVAGGGDPAAVTAALDQRVKCVVPFNSGKARKWPTRMMASEEDGLNLCDSGSFEGTRNLRLSARDGFPGWLIVAAAAPRQLVYAHEFKWDPQRDPVWERLEKVYALYGAEDNLASLRGRGSVSGPGGPKNTHCTNIGPLHREQIYPAWEDWFGFSVAESRDRRAAAELICMNKEASSLFTPRKIHQVCAELGREELRASRDSLGGQTPEEAKGRLRAGWAMMLGGVEVPQGPVAEDIDEETVSGIRASRCVLRFEQKIEIPILFLRPEGEGPWPTVVGISHCGKNAFLRSRVDAIAGLLRENVALCLVDVRGTGETSPGDERGREGEGNTVAADELMLGRTLLGSRLRDLRAVLGWLREREDVRSESIALWGPSLAAVNPGNLAPPPQDGDEIDMRSAGGGPREAWRAAFAEPLGGLLAVLGALFEAGIRGVLVERNLVSFASMLESAFTYVPLDCTVPGALAVGDLGAVINALGIPVREIGAVDGLNRTAGECERFEGDEWSASLETSSWLAGALSQG